MPPTIQFMPNAKRFTFGDHAVNQFMNYLSIWMMPEADILAEIDLIAANPDIMLQAPEGDVLCEPPFTDVALTPDELRKLAEAYNPDDPDEPLESYDPDDSDGCPGCPECDELDEADERYMRDRSDGPDYSERTDPDEDDLGDWDEPGGWRNPD